ncbi:Zinc finger protein [Oopsacas minuta]|uniref:Zinc finger protein n=1 Tax=Oopsacas minuta TaxID=111878 RepID=A0AAV7K9S5_9METZ|nr:Zinc finger protein [Oopsacas minuta]
MPKKKSGSRKKSERVKSKKKVMMLNRDIYDLGKHPSNLLMVCDQCHRVQKNRSFCYFCSSINQLAQCANCGKIKCMSKLGDCVVKHPKSFSTGLTMVGAICDHCEGFICHSKKCLSTHGCVCPLQDANCTECHRGVWSHGGRIFKCAFCESFLCEDDQFEHQASCQKLSGDDYKCGTCNRYGQFVCLNCKVSFCDEHVKRKGHKPVENSTPSCPKCSLPTKEVYTLSLSAKKYQYGKKVKDIQYEQHSSLSDANSSDEMSDSSQNQFFPN